MMAKEKRQKKKIDFASLFLDQKYFFREINAWGFSTIK